jgi:myo-inositol-1(or 4)-monophosphatase
LRSRKFPVAKGHDPVNDAAMSDYSKFLQLAESAAREAGALIRENFETDLDVDEMHAHDIKLALDVKSQELIFERISVAFPEHALYGEEGIGGNQSSDYHWIVDPIDGTVNFFYGIPHFCVSIALRLRDEIIVGVIYDPMMDELFAVERGGTPTRNGKPIRASQRANMNEAVLTLGFSKTRESMDAGLERYRQLAYEVRKTRMMGSAALAMAYIACGRLDGYIEEQISLWDIAAGWLLVEAAGGTVLLKPAETDPDKSSIVAWNGKLPLAGEL